MPPEILLTSTSHVLGDVVIDRGWALKIDPQAPRLALRQGDIEVRIVMSVMGLRCLLPGVICHFGYGFRRWDLSSQAEAFDILKSKLAVYSTGGLV
jgi:hypothetical protein